MCHKNQVLDKLVPYRKSLIIFNLASETIIRKVKEFEEINLLGRKVQITMYADESAIMSESPKKTNEILDFIYKIKCNPNKRKSLNFFNNQHLKVRKGRK